MSLSLISCNIRFDNPADGDNAWSHRRDFLCETLLSHRPQIIATQEGRIHQLRELENCIGMKLVDEHRSWIAERMYPSFFYDSSLFEYLGSGDSWLSETPDIAGSRSFDSAFPRLMTWLKIQPKNSTEKLFIANTHLDHIKAETRIQQIKVFATELKKLWKEDGKLIIMGDFNEGPEGAVREELASHFKLADAWKQFNQIETSSHHAFNGETQNGSRIDWIMVDPALDLVDCRMDKTSRNGKYPTDHFPIVCSLRV